MKTNAPPNRDTACEATELAPNQSSAGLSGSSQPDSGQPGVGHEYRFLPGEIAEVFRALGHPVRVEILHWLRDPHQHFATLISTCDHAPDAADPSVAPPAQRRGHEVPAVCATDIQAKTGLAQSTTSSNMSMLERAGLVSAQRAGKFIHYRRNEERIAHFLAVLGQNL